MQDYNLLGKRFGRLVVTEKCRHNNRVQWACVCDCGSTVKVLTHHLTRKGHKTLSCGCKKKEDLMKKSFKHGMTNTHTYNTWAGMKDRCLNPKNDRFYDYGGRGITICDRWLSFDLFLADMGEKPVGTSIDRIDNSKGYSPDNCKWSTPAEQMRNMRRNRMIMTHKGLMCLTDVANMAGLKTTCLSTRLRRNWNLNRAISEPCNVKGGKL